MFILGDLINIPESETRLPLPWWHRAPLALESWTHVFLAITQSKSATKQRKDDRPGDLLVSVLDPYRWHESFRVRCYYEETPGVVAKVFGAAAEHGWNIALAETVTVEGGRRHALDLVCEPIGHPKEPSFQPLLDALLSMGFEGIHPIRLEAPRPPAIWHRVGVVRNGWVVEKETRGLPWREQIREQIAKLNRTDEFDLSKLVVSADTDNRFLRFVVPRKGVQNVVIEHADRPGALHELTNALHLAGVNVLSSLLKRGGAHSNNAVLVAICEPTNLSVGDSNKQEQLLHARIKDQINKIPQMYRPDLKITHGKHSRDVIYAHSPDDVIIQVPRHLLPRVLDRRAALDRSRLSIFLSQRFLGGRPQAYAHEVRRVLQDEGCQVVQAPILSGGTQTSFDEVSSAMWASEAGIVLVGGPENQNEMAFSLNLAHEFGFFQGQGKPVILLVENESTVLSNLDTFSNAKGITAPRFDRKEALNDKHPESISARVKEWLELPDLKAKRKAPQS